MKREHKSLVVNLGILLLCLVLVQYLPSSREKRFIPLSNSALLITDNFS